MAPLTAAPETSVGTTSRPASGTRARVAGSTFEKDELCEPCSIFEDKGCRRCA